MPNVVRVRLKLKMRVWEHVKGSTGIIFCSVALLPVSLATAMAVSITLPFLVFVTLTALCNAPTPPPLPPRRQPRAGSNVYASGLPVAKSSQSPQPLLDPQHGHGPPASNSGRQRLETLCGSTDDVVTAIKAQSASSDAASLAVQVCSRLVLKLDMTGVVAGALLAIITTAGSLLDSMSTW
jgi:hypothetical protein